MTTDLTTLTFPPEVLDASVDGALAALTSAGANAPALIEAWTARPNAAAIAAAAEGPEGPARKAAKRALGILRARGIAVPERRRVTVFGATGAPSTKVEAWLLAPDASGGVVLILASHMPASRHKSAFIYLHDEFGIHRVEAGEQSRTQLKDAMNRLMPGGLFKPVPVPVQWARARIAAARRLQGERGVPLPLGLTTASALLDPAPAEVPQHPFDDEGLELADEDARLLATQSARLHQLPEFRAWLPPKGAVDEVLAAVGDGLTPGEPPAQELLSQLMEAAVQSATDRLFSPQVRERLVLTMKDSALSVLNRDGETAALEVVATMKRVAAAGLITDPPHEIGFLRGFFDKAISILLAQGNGSLQIPMRAPAPAAAEPTADVPADAG